MKQIVALLLQTCLLLAVHVQGAEQNSTCYGLALSSGKSYGPYQAGAILALIQAFPQGESWDALSGVTEGAINAYILSLYDQENDAAMQHLMSFWKRIGASGVYENYLLGALEGLIAQDGLYKSEPLMDILEDEFGQQPELKNSKRKLNIGITNMLNGTFVSFNDNFKSKHLVEALKSSVAYPGIFPPHQAWDSYWQPGSSIWNIDVSAPVLRCKAMGFKEDQIIIDVILDNSDEIDTVDVSTYNAFQMGYRTYEVMSYFTAKEGLLHAQRAYPDVKFRNIVGPKQTWSLDSIFKWIPINYSSHEVQRQMEQGFKDAQTVMEKSQGQSKHYELKRTVNLDL